MPTGPECPYCHQSPPDWFREWYSDSDQRQLFKGLIAADCPNPACGKGVWLGFDVKEIDPGIPIRSRSRAAAETWVRRQKAGRFADLDGFLRSSEPEAQAYRVYTFGP